MSDRFSPENPDLQQAMCSKPACTQIICIVGPTGTGKSGLALALAQHLNGAVINIDSRQVYLGLPVITAQPDLTASSGAFAQIPHLLYGFLPCTRKITAGLYAKLATEAIGLCLHLGRQPILVGGTGLYLDALLNGIAPIPPVSREISRYWQMRLERAGSRALHAELAAVDPAYAAKISHNDPQRITRALEVWQASGHSLSHWHSQPAPKLPWPALKIGLRLPLPALQTRLAVRIEQMLDAGALAEVERARNWANENPDAPGFSSIGFPELAAHINGECDLAESKRRWLASTRAYAKRQLTWFNRDKQIHWLGEGLCEHEPAALLTEALALVRPGFPIEAGSDSPQSC